ncbi:hypothetical protein FN846DRAFT_895823 [Sphaerosporella brunnea]|uniref:Uncharacterized protein n=1 Tax=Sphaerosporella brunnea TaxID=1250544 RepID=A0A5J5EF64_9PEZI|nr:hypothetical protein FN846DRAFT_896037 [Sphaerosporella brunnea]KAA8893629.1 hypothetical protein FN846DRAFT_895823 [Sphaerosporella brunnea]
MARKRRSGAQQRAYKIARRHEQRCQNERFRRSLAELRAHEREIVDQDYELFQQLQREAEVARHAQEEAVRQAQQEATRQEEQEEEIELDDSDSDKENNLVLPIGRTRPR